MIRTHGNAARSPVHGLLLVVLCMEAGCSFFEFTLPAERWTGTYTTADATAVLQGVDAQCIGADLARVGDVDGDGTDDLFAGGQCGAHDESLTGAAVVVQGPVTGTLSMPSQADVHLFHDEPLTYAGQFIHGPGDVDGDGRADLLVSARGRDTAHLILAPVSGSRHLDTADTVFHGLPGSDTGAQLSSGDIDGDGHTDIMVGSRRYGDDEGRVYLLRADSSGQVELEDAPVVLHGRVGQALGGLASVLGDLDGDGFDEVGASVRDPAGAVVIHRPVTGDALDQAELVLTGACTAYADVNLQGAGDITGDGTPDLLVGDYRATPGGQLTLIPGGSRGTFDIATSVPRLVGSDDVSMLGFSIDATVDLDLDGFADIVLGLNLGTGKELGALVIYGPISGVSEAPVVAGARFTASGLDNSLVRAIVAGDLDGDHVMDLALGASHARDGYGDRIVGQVFVFPGTPEAAP